MTSFHLTVSSADKLLYDGMSAYCNVNTDSGSLGIESKHEPFLSVLRDNSQVRFQDQSGTEKTIEISRGLLLFEDNKCVITVSVPKS